MTAFAPLTIAWMTNEPPAPLVCWRSRKKKAAKDRHLQKPRHPHRDKIDAHEDQADSEEIIGIENGAGTCVLQLLVGENQARKALAFEEDNRSRDQQNKGQNQREELPALEELKGLEQTERALKHEVNPKNRKTETCRLTWLHCSDISSLLNVRAGLRPALTVAVALQRRRLSRILAAYASRVSRSGVDGLAGVDAQKSVLHFARVDVDVKVGNLLERCGADGMPQAQALVGKRLRHRPRDAGNRGHQRAACGSVEFPNIAEMLARDNERVAGVELAKVNEGHREVVFVDQTGGSSSRRYLAENTPFAHRKAPSFNIITNTASR